MKPNKSPSSAERIDTATKQVAATLGNSAIKKFSELIGAAKPKEKETLLHAMQLIYGVYGAVGQRAEAALEAETQYQTETRTELASYTRRFFSPLFEDALNSYIPSTIQPVPLATIALYESVRNPRRSLLDRRRIIFARSKGLTNEQIAATERRRGVLEATPQLVSNTSVDIKKAVLDSWELDKRQACLANANDLLSQYSDNPLMVVGSLIQWLQPDPPVPVIMEKPRNLSISPRYANLPDFAGIKAAQAARFERHAS